MASQLALGFHSELEDCFALGEVPESIKRNKGNVFNFSSRKLRFALCFLEVLNIEPQLHCLDTVRISNSRETGNMKSNTVQAIEAKHESVYIN